MRNHVQFAFWVGSKAQHLPQQAAALIPSLRRHEALVVTTLEAHIENQPLPDYSPLPLHDFRELINWSTS
ncbi:MAG: hypothetical protein ACYDEY_00315 [Acidimicrobiales bacterium]